jgi:hypothetical protein
MCDLDRVFQIMDDLQTPHREQYRNMSKQDAADRINADFLFAIIKAGREEKERVLQ